MSLKSMVEKWLRRPGELTDSEIINSFLLEAADTAEIGDVLAALNALPDELQSKFVNRLDQLAADNYRFLPPIIGPGPSDAEIQRLCSNLQALHAKLRETFLSSERH
jgi:hypothetical protein